MSARNGSTDAKQGNMKLSDQASFDKGKGKAVDSKDKELITDEEDSSSGEEVETAEVEDEADEDNMEEIDPSNIIPSGRRTRGRQIDFAKAAEELPEADDEDDDEDDDFEEPIADEDKMEE